MDTKTNLLANSIKSAKDVIDFINANKKNISAKEAKTIYKDIEFIKGRLNAYKTNYNWSCIDTDVYPLRGRNTANPDTRNSDFLNKALIDNDNVDAVAGVIDTIISTPRQDAQPKTDKEADIEHRLNVEETLAKRHKAIRQAIINIISDAVYGKRSCIDTADSIINLVNDANKQVIEDYIWCARTVYRLNDDIVSEANTDSDYIVNVDAANNSKDKSDRRVFSRDANGRMVELRGDANYNPDELY